MLDKGREELRLLTVKIDELIERFNSVKSEYGKLKLYNIELEKRIDEYSGRIKELEIKNERYRLSGALMGEEGNAVEAKRKISDLVREIDKCVALLNK